MTTGPISGAGESQRISPQYRESRDHAGRSAFATAAFAQEPGTEAPGTRTEAIENERADKVAELWPERQSPIVNTVKRSGRARFQGRFGFRARRQRSPDRAWRHAPGSGFTAGLGYRQSDLSAGASWVPHHRASTFQGAYLFDADLDFQGLRTERTSLRWYTKFESSPDIDYYGLGNTSPKENHTSFAYDDLTTDFDAALEAFRHVRLGFTGGTCGHTRRRATMIFRLSTEVFTPEEIPGFGEDTQFTRVGAFVDFDFRDSRTGPWSGGLYGMRYRETGTWIAGSSHSDRPSSNFSSTLPYFNKGRVVAVRSAILLSFPKEGNQLPVYLQPVLGGNDDLRGFGGYRFRDNHLGLRGRRTPLARLEQSRHGRVRRCRQGRAAQTPGRPHQSPLQRRYRIPRASALRHRQPHRFRRIGGGLPDGLDLQRHLQNQVVGAMMSRRVILAVLIAAIAPAAALAQTQTPRFYPDDPLRNEPVPLPVPDPQPRALSDILERINNTFKTTGQRHPSNGVILAGGVNTLGEVMDGDWHVNRHGTRRMTIDELQRGPGTIFRPRLEAHGRCSWSSRSA